MRTIFTLFAIFMLAISSFAADLWVDIDAADTTGTGTISSPLKYIGQTRHKTSANSVVHIMPGTYDESAYGNKVYANIIGTTTDKTGMKYIAEGKGVLVTYSEVQTGVKFADSCYDIEFRGINFGNFASTSSQYIDDAYGYLKFISCSFDNHASYSTTILDRDHNTSTYFFDCSFGDCNNAILGDTYDLSPSLVVFDQCTFGSEVNAILETFAALGGLASVKLNNSIVNATKIVKDTATSHPATFTINNCIYYGPTDAAVFTWTNSILNTDAVITWDTEFLRFNISASSSAWGLSSRGTEAGCLQPGFEIY